LVQSPEEWAWSSFRHYLSGVDGVVEIESQWTVSKREEMGSGLSIAGKGSQNPRPVAENATRAGHPRTSE
jgi:putative transposase